MHAVGWAVQGSSELGGTVAYVGALCPGSGYFVVVGHLVDVVARHPFVYFVVGVYR